MSQPTRTTEMNPGTTTLTLSAAHLGQRVEIVSRQHPTHGDTVTHVGTYAGRYGTTNHLPRGIVLRNAIVTSVSDEATTTRSLPLSFVHDAIGQVQTVRVLAAA